MHLHTASTSHELFSNIVVRILNPSAKKRYKQYRLHHTHQNGVTTHSGVGQLVGGAKPARMRRPPQENTYRKRRSARSRQHMQPTASLQHSIRTSCQPRPDRSEFPHTLEMLDVGTQRTMTKQWFMTRAKIYCKSESFGFSRDFSSPYFPFVHGGDAASNAAELSALASKSSRRP